MADEDKNHPRDWGHLKSPLFNKLPPEVRNKIYHETFAGSEIDLVLDPPLDTRVVPITGRRSIFSCAKSTHNFLLTCFQVYSEALAIYWSLTVIGNLRDPGLSGKGRHFSRGYFLNRIPAVARQHVQHLRSVSLAVRPGNEWLQGDTISQFLKVAEALDFFPNLKSCSFLYDCSWTFVLHVCGEVAARHPHIHTLTRRYAAPADDAPPLPNLGIDGYWLRVIFEDFKSGKSLSWYQPVSADQWISNKAAYQMVLNAPDDEIKAAERCLETKALNYRDPLDSLKSAGCVVS